MKRFYLVVILMAVASFTFAQTATVNQVNLPGTSSVNATVMQTGTNVATVTQTNEVGAIGGNFIDAYVEQIQTGVDANTVDVMQSVLDDEENPVSLTTRAFQFGSNNTIMQTQTADGHRNDFVARYFIADQNGNGNMAYQTSTDSDQGVVNFMINQNGDDNEAHQLTQNEGGWANGNIWQTQNGNFASQTFESIWANGDITQDGMTNNAVQHFHNNTKDNYANILQVGSNNGAMQVFDGGNTSFSQLYATQMGDGSYANQMVISGNDNWGTVVQYGDAGLYAMVDGNSAYQTFLGNLNTGDIFQNYGMYNTATQTFGGNEDYGIIDQTGMNGNMATQTFAGTSLGNWASIFQDTDWDNFATQYVEGMSNMLYITQTGYGWHGRATQNVFGAASMNNTLTINQTGGDYNNATQTVMGNDNTLMIEQNGIWWGLGDNATQTVYGNSNYTEIVQILDNNLSSQYIDGDMNSQKVLQSGNGATAYFTTYGTNNMAALEQNGDGSYADILQDGDWNVVQGIGGLEFGENSNGSSLMLQQFGTGHTLNISQTAFGGAATVGQSGVGNVATVIQN